MTPEFIPFPKIPRLMKGDIVLTEKIDGTNGVVFVHKVGEADAGHIEPPDIIVDADSGRYQLRAGSRNRWLAPGKMSNDGFGFLAWVQDNAAQLIKLGEGMHRGEWYGAGIQRGYGLEGRSFALFNVGAWCDTNSPYNHWTHDGQQQIPAIRGLSLVPVLYRGAWFGSSMDPVGEAMRRLRFSGSTINTRFDAEGVMLYHEASGLYFKVPFDGDPKGQRG